MWNRHSCLFILRHRRQECLRYIVINRRRSSFVFHQCRLVVNLNLRFVQMPVEGLALKNLFFAPSWLCVKQLYFHR